MLCATKIINIITLVLSEIKFLNETKNHNPSPFKLNGLSLTMYNVIHDRNQNACKKIEELKETFELLDPWRTCYPVDKKFTWRQTFPIKQSRIDYFLVSLFFSL